MFFFFFALQRHRQDALDFFCQDMYEIWHVSLLGLKESLERDCVQTIVRYIFRAGFVIRSCYTMPTAFDKKSNTDDRVIPWLCLPKNTMSALPTVLLTTYLYWNICTLLTIDPKPHCTPDTIYLPASQRTPPYPGGQAQTNLFTRSLHDPPFWHGLLAHSFISERQIQVTVKTRLLLYRHRLNTDTSLLRTVFFVHGERKPLHFL